MTEEEFLRGLLLRRLIEEHPGGVPREQLLGDCTDEDDASDAAAALADLETLGYAAERESAGGELLVGLTEGGAAHARELEARRTDPTARRRACRNGLTMWLRQATSAKGLDVARFVLAPSARFAGDIFTVDEIVDAAAYLRDKGLLATGFTASGPGGQFLDARLTHLGIDCADEFGGDVNAYLHRASTPGGTGSVSVSGTGNTVQVQQQSPGAQQQAATNQTFSDINAWADNVERALPESGLTQAEVTDIRDQLAELRAELAQPAPNRSRLKVLGRATIKILSAAKDVAEVASAMTNAASLFV